MRTLLVGLDNPHSGDPKRALAPLPSDATGGRIVDLIQTSLTDYTMKDYLRDFDRVNLYPIKMAASGKGATKTDRLMAQWCLMYAMRGGYENVVLFGNRVKAAFADITPEWPNESDYCRVGDTISFWYMPHPSGRNRWYNDKRNQLLVGERLAQLRERRHRERSR